jgi:N-acetyl-beta-hexosaminidase
MTEETIKIPTKEEIAETIFTQLKLIVEPAMQQVGKNMVDFHNRLQDCEKALNVLIEEMKDWKENNGKVLN